MPHSYLRPCTALLLLLLGACASIEPPLESSWEEQRQRLQDLTVWQASGKIALQNADSSETGSLAWSQREQHSELRLSGPAGLSSTRITSDGRSLSIRRGDQNEQFDISSPESIRANTGWDLPLAALPYWIKGLPAPQLDIDDQTVEGGLLRTLQQGGWQLLYGNYGSFDDYRLPTRLDLSRGDTRARLVIRRWQPGAGP